METRNTYRANARRSGQFWAIDVPELPGVFSQVRRLDQVGAIVRDAIAAFLNADPDNFDVLVHKELEPEVEQLIIRASTAKGRAAIAQAESSNAQRFVARQLTAAGYTTRDIGALLGISHQRVAQLLDTLLESPSAAATASAFGHGNEKVKVFEVGKGWREVTARELVAEEELRYPSSDPPKGFRDLKGAKS